MLPLYNLLIWSDMRCRLFWQIHPQVICGFLDQVDMKDKLIADWLICWAVCTPGGQSLTLGCLGMKDCFSVLLTLESILVQTCQCLSCLCAHSTHQGVRSAQYRVILMIRRMQVQHAAGVAGKLSSLTVVVVVALSLHTRIFGECSMVHSLPVHFLIFFFSGD